MLTKVIDTLENYFKIVVGLHIVLILYVCMKELPESAGTASDDLEAPVRWSVLFTNAPIRLSSSSIDDSSQSLPSRPSLPSLPGGPRRAAISPVGINKG